MNQNCKYEVCTYWGWFRLDEGAYQDYLRGKLWISWVPGQKEQLPTEKSKPCNVTAEAELLQKEAARGNPYSIFRQHFPDSRITAPYRDSMGTISTYELSLSVRSSNGLMRAGIDCLGRLAETLLEENGLRKIRNLGAKSETEILNCFFNHCYSLLSTEQQAVWWQQMLDDREREDRQIP